MTIADATDTALIAELRAKLEQAGNEVEGWQQRAREALNLCEQAQSELAELRCATAADAEQADAANEPRASSFWHAMWKERTRQRDEQDRRIAALEREVEQLRCGDLMPFHDGDLSPERHSAFKAHLGRCAECQRDLVACGQLDERFADADPRSPRREVARAGRAREATAATLHLALRDMPRSGRLEEEMTTGQGRVQRDGDAATKAAEVILQGERDGGERLVASEIAARFGVTPRRVQLALKRLRGVTLEQHEPRRHHTWPKYIPRESIEECWRVCCQSSVAHRFDCDDAPRGSRVSRGPVLPIKPATPRELTARLSR